MAAFLLLNGPNLNLLGTREPDVYGDTSLDAIESRCLAIARKNGHSLRCFQSNSEHELIERIHQAAGDRVDLIVFNPGAFTHTSIALRDALLGVGVPFIELHLSNTYARETFRHTSYFSDIAHGCVIGFGHYGYELAMQAADRYVAAQEEK